MEIWQVTELMDGWTGAAGQTQGSSVAARRGGSGRGARPPARLGLGVGAVRRTIGRRRHPGRGLEPRELGAQGVEDRPDVVDLLAVGDDAEVEVVAVAHDGDVQADAVDD